jgi:hypothetical protein
VVAAEKLENDLAMMRKAIQFYRVFCLRKYLCFCGARSQRQVSAPAPIRRRLRLAGPGAPGYLPARGKGAHASAARTKGDPNFDDGADFK